MKVIKFDGDINYESIKKLFEDIDKVSITDDIVLYMNSAGGSCSDATDLSDYINRQSNRFEIVCSWEMSSSALDLLLNVNCKIKLINGMFSRVHLYSNKLEYKELNDKNSISRYLLNDCDKANSEWLNKLLLAGFTTEEIAEIKSGIILTINSIRVKHIIEVLNPKAILA
jgi:hypothetical protein